jgi:hypothetical protein
MASHKKLWAGIAAAAVLIAVTSAGASANQLRGHSRDLVAPDFSAAVYDRDWDNGVGYGEYYPGAYLGSSIYVRSRCYSELGSRLIKSTIQGWQPGIQKPSNFAPACRSG